MKLSGPVRCDHLVKARCAFLCFLSLLGKCGVMLVVPWRFSEFFELNAECS